MDIKEWLSIASIVGTVFAVPFGASYWAIQRRLSRIEGVLEVVLRKVR